MTSSFSIRTAGERHSRATGLRFDFALIKLNQIHVDRLVCTQDVRVGIAAKHARRESRGAPIGVGLRVGCAVPRVPRLWRRCARARRLSATLRRPKPRCSGSIEFLIRHSDVSSAMSGRRTSGWKSVTRNCSRPMCDRKRWPRMRSFKQQAAAGKLAKAQYLRFTSPERTPYPENDLVNARWFPAPRTKIRNGPSRPSS